MTYEEMMAQMFGQPVGKDHDGAGSAGDDPRDDPGDDPGAERAADGGEATDKDADPHQDGSIPGAGADAPAGDPTDTVSRAERHKSKGKKRKKRKRTAKDRVITVIEAALLLFFIGLFLYPTVSARVNSYKETQLIVEYEAAVSSTAADEIAAALEAAQAYNASHTTNYIRDAWSDDDDDDSSVSSEYDLLLNMSGNGVMGYIEIPAINVKLAIYHGTSEEVLQKGCGHVEGTSLPVGGESSHCVLSAHRGLASAKLFTDLDLLEIGDVFYITVLGETYTYEVDQILTVLPEETDALAIEEGEDLVTLVTCTPYGVNTHRLLVRGKRVYEDASEEADTDDTGDTGETADAVTDSGSGALTLTEVLRSFGIVLGVQDTIFLAGLLLILIAVIILLMRRRRRRGDDDDSG